MKQEQELTSLIEPQISQLVTLTIQWYLKNFMRRNERNNNNNKNKMMIVVNELKLKLV